MLLSLKCSKNKENTTLCCLSDTVGSALFDRLDAEYFVAVIKPKEISREIGLTENKLIGASFFFCYQFSRVFRSFPVVSLFKEMSFTVISLKNGISTTKIQAPMIIRRSVLKM